MNVITYVFVISLAISPEYCERTSEKIYVEVGSAARSPCLRRMNATHQIGCSSDPKGNVGVVHYVTNMSDIDWLVNYGPHQPYAVLMNAMFFNTSVVQRLLSSGKVNGIMVIHVQGNEMMFAIPPSFSPDKACPNDGYDLYKDDKNYFGPCTYDNDTWNPAGNGMMFQDLSIPIFIFTQQSDVEFAINKCFKRFNEPDAQGNPRDYPLCAVQLKDRMDGAKDSETCIRRTSHPTNLNPDRYCDPLGDQNVYATIKSINSSETRPNRSVIIIAARMDSFSLFENHYPSADNHVSGMVALLAVAEAIGKIKAKFQNSMTKDIMFTFFNGEAFDYIGSSRMVYDMEHNNFPLPIGTYLHTINLTHISHFVEVNQLAHRDDGKLWIHTEPMNRINNAAEVKNMIEILQSIDRSLIDDVKTLQSLPPSSVQSFLKKRVVATFPSIVITDHRRGYTNKYFNSRFDTYSSIANYPSELNDTEKYDYISDQATNLTRVATMLAWFLYELATGDNKTENITADNSTVNHLLYCYLISPKCELFKEILSAEKASVLADQPYSFYVGVNSMTNNYTVLTNQLLLRYLGDEMENITDKGSCTDTSQTVFHYTWMEGSLNITTNTRRPFCIRGTANFSDAQSMAFEINDYNYSSGEFPTWTESFWAVDAIDVRFFLIPSKKFEVATLIIGVLILLVSLLGGFYMEKTASILFDSATPEPSMNPNPVSV